MRTRLIGALALIAASSAAVQGVSAQGVEYRTVVLRGGAAPGVAGAVTFRTFGDPMIAGSGDVAFEATIAGLGVTTGSDEGFWAEKNGVLTLIAREGDQAPGRPAGVVFERIIDPVINANGNAAFRAWLAGPGIDVTNRDSVWAETDGGPLAMIVQGGTPSAVAGVDFGGFQTVLMANSDRVVFKAILVGATVNVGNDEGVVAQTSPGAIELVAREGDQAQGTNTGVVYGTIDVVTANDSGAAVIDGIVTGPGVDAFTRNAFWVHTPGASIALAARAGETAPGTGGAMFLDVGGARLNDAGGLTL